MEEKELSYQLSIEGTFLDCPANLMVGQVNNHFAFAGEIDLTKQSIPSIIENHFLKTKDGIYSFVTATLPSTETLSTLRVSYYDNLLILTSHLADIQFSLAKLDDSVACLFMLDQTINNKQTDNNDTLQKITKVIGDIQQFLGLNKMLVYVQTRPNDRLFSHLFPMSKQVPQDLRPLNFIVLAQADFTQKSPLGLGIRKIFGIERSDFYLGIGQNEIFGSILLPKINNQLFIDSSIGLEFVFSNNLQLKFKGSFSLTSLPDVTFNVDCQVGSDGFGIEAYTELKKPVPILGPFSIGDTALQLKLNTTGINIGFYSTLFLREIELFGAIILNVTPTGPVPQLLSAAISDLSIPILVNNIVNRPIDGIEVLDFIKLEGLNFQQMKFNKEELSKLNIEYITQNFNQKLNNATFSLTSAESKIQPFSKGYDLIDLKRMRHYYISQSGDLELMAQFYYSTITTSLGSYTIEKGIFFCSVIEILKKRFEVVFALNEKEGLLAYAKIPEIDLGFIKLGPSVFNKQSGNTLPIASNSVLSQFIQPNDQGIVFFLSAKAKEVSFYFDGSIDVLHLFSVDSRIIYMNRQIMLDLRSSFLGMLDISLHLQLDYSSFSSGKFAFSLMIDTSSLTKKLVAVTQSIDRAIQKVSQKINDAKAKVEQARSQVNELYRQIEYFDGKIEECRQAIRSAKWWKKAFVAIAKGIEIAAYEVAKLGIRTAIALANAALDIAQGILSIFGKIGETVLKAINGMIKGAMSLFYINYVKLEAQADPSNQYFLAEFDFIVLGKHYNLHKQIGKAAFKNNSVGELSSSINNHISNDLNHIEDGTFRSTWREYYEENYSVSESMEQLSFADQQLYQSVKLMQNMQKSYVKNMNSPLEECDHMNTSLVDALSHVQNVFQAGVQLADFSTISQAMGGLKRSVTAKEKNGVVRDEELAQTKAIIQQYDEANDLYKQMQNQIKKVARYQENLMLNNQKIYNQVKEENMLDSSQPENVEKLINDVQNDMYRAFPVNRIHTNFINLSCERLIQNMFKEIEQRHNITPKKRIQKLRSLSRKGSYENRLS